MKKFFATALVAFMALGIWAGIAGATIGPYGGRTMFALSPDKGGVTPQTVVSVGQIQGDGGTQYVNVRTMVYYGGKWNQHGNVGTTTIPSGYQSRTFYVSNPCNTNGVTYTWRTEVKWSTWSWSQADKSGTATFACP